MAVSKGSCICPNCKSTMKVELYVSASSRGAHSLVAIDSETGAELLYMTCKDTKDDWPHA